MKAIAANKFAVMLALALLVASYRTALADTGHSSAPLSLGAAIAEADINNSDILAAKQAIEVQIARLEQAAPNPLQGQLSDGSSPDTPGGLGILQTHTVGVQQQFDPPGVLAAWRQAAKAAAEGARASYRVTRRDVELRVIDAFYALAGASAVRVVSEENVRVTANFAAAAQKRARAGEVGSFEVLRASNELRRSQTDLMRAQASEQNSRIQLNTLLGRLPDTPTEVISVSAASTVAAKDRIIDQALATDPQAAVLRAQLAQSIAQAHAGRLRRLPTLSISVGTQSITAVTLPSPSKGPAIGASLSIPLFDYGTLRGAVHEAQAAKAVAQAQLQGRELAVRAEVMQALASLQAAQAQLDFARASRTQAEKALQIAEFGYRQGAFGALDILSARNSAIAARGQEEQSANDVASAIARLALLEGITPTP